MASAEPAPVIVVVVIIGEHGDGRGPALQALGNKGNRKNDVNAMLKFTFLFCFLLHDKK